MKTLKETALNAIQGFFMAMADSVPGVSGGTVAFILGFYSLFIGSINNLFFGTKNARIKAVKFLLKLGLGWVIGFALSTLFLTSIFESQIYAVSSVFMGFIIAAIPIIYLEEKDTYQGHLGYLVFSLIGCAVVVGITFINPTEGAGTSVAASDLSIGLAIYTFVCAMVAISAMVLPGISGSTLLLIFGLYIPIISAVKEVLTLNFEYLPILIIFAMGIVMGALLFIKLLNHCLQKFRPQTLYTIMGLMIGSLYSISQGPLSLEKPLPALSLDTFNIAFFLVGVAVIFGLQALKKVLTKD